MDIRWGSKKVFRIVKDYISTLPDDLIHQILKFVDTKSAVRTSTLSKRWKLVWTSLPFLALQCPQKGPKKASTNFARHVLKHRDHDSGVSRLMLAFLPQGLHDRFIQYAISHRVQELKVCSRKDHSAVKLFKFRCDSIRVLVLRIKVEDDVSESNCWVLPALTKLNLEVLPTGHAIRVLPVRYLNCLRALRDLSLKFLDICDPELCFSLPDLTTLCLNVCKMNVRMWNLPALKTLKLCQVEFRGNICDMFAALVSLENLTLYKMSMKDCYIRCPQLINLRMMAGYKDNIQGNIVVFAPKLTNFTCVGVFPIIFEDSELENVYLKVGGGNFRNLEKLKEHYQRFVSMLPGLGSAKILYIHLETITALSTISEFLAKTPPPFYNLKYVKLPSGFKEASLSNIVRNYLLGGSPTAAIVATGPQKIIPHTASASVRAQNVVIEEICAAPTRLVDSNDRQKTVCTDTVEEGVQEELLVQNSNDKQDLM